ncbi:MAG: hypothetical protein ABW046_23205 [Actinoplanes sp.]
MFSHKDKAERTASQAWDYLASAMASAGESAKEAGKYTADLAGGKAAQAGGKAAEYAGKANKRSQKLADKASKRSQKLTGRASKKGNRLVGAASGKADEAWSRANAAAAALAGHKPRRPWGLIAGIGLLGLAAGWAAASSARAALERQAENEELELAETAVVVTPTFDR